MLTRLLLLMLVVVGWCRAAAASVCLLILLAGLEGLSGLAGLEGRGLESCRHYWLVRAISHSRPALALASTTTTTTSSLPGAGGDQATDQAGDHQSPGRPRTGGSGGQWRAVEGSVSSSAGRQCVSLLTPHSSLTVNQCQHPHLLLLLLSSQI